MPNDDNIRAFFAYPFEPPLLSETLRTAADIVSARGGQATSWEKLSVSGRVIIDEVCREIDETDVVVAEISHMNSNVLFEAGYALAQDKNLQLALDQTNADAIHLWKEVSIFETIGRIEYEGNNEKLASNVLNMMGRSFDNSILENLLLGGRPREANAVFAPSLPTKFTAASALEKWLDRQIHLKILGSSEDLGLAPIDFYVKEVYRSSACIFHLLGPQRVRAVPHNARASFFAGFSHGLRLPTLMVVEEGFHSPIDYKNLLFVYSSSAALQEHVKAWLAELPKSPGSNKRLGRLSLDIELPIQSFGEYVAENETAELADYFVQTNEFSDVLAGRVKVFTGRKGTGKTATMTQAHHELSADRRNLVVGINPTSYELGGLISTVSALQSKTSQEYLFLNLWTYLIYTEIAISAINHAQSQPAGIGENTAVRDLEIELDNFEIDVEADLATRLEVAISSLGEVPTTAGAATQEYIARKLRTTQIKRLEQSIVKAVVHFDRVAVLVDNLDKTWEKNSDYELMSHFLLSLLSTAGMIERNFARTRANKTSINVTMTVFLRTDIFDVISKFAREPDKIGARTVQWQDEQLLVRVLEDRYAARRSTKLKSVPDMWQEIFNSEVRGLPTRDYFLWRVLPRPRDFIYLANGALTTAINRKHDRIEEADILFSEMLYSRFAFDALIVESEAEGFDLEELLYDFAGLDSTFTEGELRESLSGANDFESVKRWLIQSSFLGIETGPGEFVHVEGANAARRKLKVASRDSERRGTTMRYRVHPAFRAALEIRDEDLHSPEINDATLRD